MKGEKSKKIAFIDRDGVINKCAAPHEYITSVKDFILNQGIITLLRKLQEQEFELIIITNQRGIARTKLTEKTLAEIHSYMSRQFAEAGIKILDIFYCPHEIDSCDCRKPKDGMLRKAFQKYSINISKSIIISDSNEDIEMGTKFGLGKQILIPKDNPIRAVNEIPKNKIAFIKFGGLSTGGTEKMLQIIAANLDKKKFDVDYYYCDSAPYRDSNYKHPDTDVHRLNYMLEHGVNLIKFKVGMKDITTPTHVWVDTDFWEKFNEESYDIIQTGRAGHKEYPFTQIRKTPFLEIIALSAGVDNQFNLARSLHICNWSAKKWISAGGDKKRIEIISLPVEIEKKEYADMRTELGLEDFFIYGIHQRPSDDIFSSTPLAAYKQIENEKTAFLILGGGNKYKEQAKELAIKKIIFLPATGSSEYIFNFLATLNVYAHGRKDGEVNSQAIAEAMYFGLPVVSHLSKVNNGHVECIDEAGVVVDENDTDAYATEMLKLKNYKDYYNVRSQAARQRFADNYELTGQMKRIEAIYEDVIKNPFPLPVRRFLYSMHWTQNIRIWVKWLYLKTKHFY